VDLLKDDSEFVRKDSIVALANLAKHDDFANAMHALSLFFAEQVMMKPDHPHKPAVLEAMAVCFSSSFKLL